ncbi:5151_t:CDS:2 [Entrophospora sp. SA101]|nr:5151_t:CDS:2 [Entrophospora sp. SA101]
MYSYYVSNTKDEIKSAYQELNETEFEQVVIQSNLHFSVEDNDNDGESEEQWAASEINQNLVTFEELINVDDEELQHVLGIEVSVVIPPYEIIEHGDPEFDVEFDDDDDLGLAGGDGLVFTIVVEILLVEFDMVFEGVELIAESVDFIVVRNY